MQPEKPSKSAKAEKPQELAKPVKLPKAPKPEKAPKAPKPDRKVSGTHLWLVLIKAYHSLLGFTEHTLRSSGLGESEFRILEALLHKGALPVNTIGARVFLTPGSISVAIDRLLKRGLVTRTLGPTDRRIRLVDLTPKGRALIERVFAAHAAQVDELSQILSPKERRQAARILKALGKAAARHPD
ncbi:MAG TPA: MarR family transcriptional regulator [Acidobacteriaceae bacterium]|nr:MarR family transcriptional regulator [Acidobacteriaceae bacterium]